jgi:hypothetical protein
MYLSDAKLALHNNLWQTSPRPFKFVGCAGIIGLSFLMSFKNAWSFSKAPGYSEFIPAVLMIILLWWLTENLFNHLSAHQILLGGAPLAAALGYTVLQTELPNIFAALIFNMYLLAVGLITIKRGVITQSLVLLNGGMFLVAALITARFFDTDMSFEMRGAVFVLIGLSLLAANMIMLKRINKKRGKESS